jgi:Uma2 family endonuclease
VISTAALVPIDEYLASSYEPDREYVAGRLVERRVGEYPHSRLQGLICVILHALDAHHPVCALIGRRLRVNATPGAERFRVPDVCLARRPLELERGVLVAPPLPIVEVLSPDDTLHEVLEKAGEYQHLGTGHVCVADPHERILYGVTARGLEIRPERKIDIPGLGTIDLGPAFEDLAAE